VTREPPGSVETQLFECFILSWGTWTLVLLFEFGRWDVAGLLAEDFCRVRAPWIRSCRRGRDQRPVLGLDYATAVQARGKCLVHDSRRGQCLCGRVVSGWDHWELIRLAHLHERSAMPFVSRALCACSPEGPHIGGEFSFLRVTRDECLGCKSGGGVGPMRGVIDHMPCPRSLEAMSCRGPPAGLWGHPGRGWLRATSPKLPPSPAL